MSTATTHQPRTRVGQDRLDDYTPYVGDEFLTNVLETSTYEAMRVEETTTTAVMALMDPDGTLKHKVICTKTVTHTVVKSETIDIITDLWPAEQGRSYNSLREPDMYDDEQAIWLNNTGMVAVDIAKLRGFNGYIRANCMSPGGGGWTKREFTTGLSTWDFFKAVVCK